jgi:hypothetical protein
MPRIQPVDSNDIGPDIRKAFNKHTTAYNTRITNMKATLGHSVVAFEVYMQWYPLYEEVRKITGERLAYLFAYSISFAADCPLCTMYFRKIIIDAGESPENFVVDEQGQQLLSFGSAIAKNQGFVEDESFDALKKQYNDEQLVVLIAFAGQMIATNIFNNVIDTEIDSYLSDYLPRNKIKK